ncbi:hypothetical protein OPV22_003746 [Ensete ventricosum]|uniref:Uncharacterized protein n=1 Tax=Ensete ventricosum TaxID=4639 RepID=A0AAV8S1G4_ENSVE|nr:hypothetical protein OPV22_003746 [Ensete ventricosum]
MEEAKPPPSAPQAPSVPAPAAAEVPEGRSKKRKLDAAEFWESDYYKLRLAVKNLRPLFVEVLRTPDFRSSKVAHDLQNQMKTVLELTQKLRGDVTSYEKCKKPSETVHSLKVQNEEPLEKPPENKTLNAHPQAGDFPTAPEKASQSEKATSISDSFQGTTAPEIKEKAKQLDEAFQGTYVIGGSKLELPSDCFCFYLKRTNDEIIISYRANGLDIRKTAQMNAFHYRL